MPQLEAGSIIEMVDIQVWNDVTPIYNVYWWYTSVPVDSGDLGLIATDWNANYRDDVRAIQTSAVKHTNLKLTSYEADGPGVQGLFTQGNVPGTKAGEAQPIINTFGIKFFGATRETRPGFKRIAGPVEADSSGSDIIGATVTAVGVAMSFYAADWVIATVPDLVPVIVKRTVTVNGTTVTLTPENWIYNPIVSLGVSTKIRSQVSRQFAF
jgi:hypothetical protein